MKNYKKESLETLKEIVSYNTVRGEEKEGAPFGETNKKCLTRFLEIASKLGFDVKDVDGYAGHVEWKGKGEGLVGILGHLDVVPAGEGWTHDPFACEVEDGYMYGRGVLDDKGPVVSCLYAMKELKDEGFVPEKTIRLIVGCNEENGSTCVEHYFKKEAMPDIGFSPDGDFPCIHCEKGIVWVKVTLPDSFGSFSEINGGDKTNMVAAKATCKYVGSLSAEWFEERGIKAERSESGALYLTACGKNGHGSTPWVGDNAVWKLFKVMTEAEDNELSKYVYNNFCLDHYGKASGIFAEDEKSGGLSENLGTIATENGKVELTLDIRYPTATSVEKILSVFEKNAPSSVTFTVLNNQAALFADTEGYLVKTLMSIYRKHTGSTTPSLIIGGGTYAREMKYGVAFGPMMEGEVSTIHMPDERLNLEYYDKFYDIYKEAIEELSK